MLPEEKEGRARDRCLMAGWRYGIPATARTYFNDGAEPDPYPSPGGIFPFTATDLETHAYLMAGAYDLRLIVRDDDGGTCSLTIRIAVA